MRFNRFYELRVAFNTSEVTIKPPVRIQFNGSKSLTGALSNIKISIFNLKQSTREQLQKNPEQNIPVNVNLKIGYIGEKIETIFNCSLWKGTTIRQGADFVTTLECVDGYFDYQNAFISKTVNGNDTAIQQIIESMPEGEIGKITQRKQLVRPKVLFGKSVDLMKKYLDEDEVFFIDNKQVNIIKKSEVRETFIPIVSAETGLLTTPESEFSKVTFSTIMNPSLKIGSRCQLISKTAPAVNGIYKIETVNYVGDYAGKDWLQKCDAFKLSEYKVL